MSEISVSHRENFVVDPVAFFVALICAPILVTAATFWVAFIPVFALLIGGPIYLAFGIPVLLWRLRHHDASPADIALFGVAD